MPEELLSEQVQRLAVFAAIAGTLWSFALLLDITVLPAANGTGLWNWRTIPVEIAAKVRWPQCQGNRLRVACLAFTSYWSASRGLQSRGMARRRSSRFPSASSRSRASPTS